MQLANVSHNVTDKHTNWRENRYSILEGKVKAYGLVRPFWPNFTWIFLAKLYFDFFSKMVLDQQQNYQKRPKPPSKLPESRVSGPKKIVTCEESSRFLLSKLWPIESTPGHPGVQTLLLKYHGLSNLYHGFALNFGTVRRLGTFLHRISVIRMYNALKMLNLQYYDS